MIDLNICWIAAKQQSLTHNCSGDKHWLQGIRVMMRSVTFNNISVISWRSVLLVEKTTDIPQVTDKLYHIRVHHERDSNPQF